MWVAIFEPNNECKIEILGGSHGCVGSPLEGDKIGPVVNVFGLSC